MTNLLTHDGDAPEDAPGNRTGGLPLAPAGFTWPTCAECDRPLQFLAQLLLDDDRRLLAIFQCANDPGLCDEWDANAGGNRAYLFDNQDLRPVPAPGGGETGLGAVSAIRTEPPAEDDYDEAIAAWAARTGRSRREVLGGIGGEPSWLQFDQTPSCVDCARPMRFAAHLEEGRDSQTAINLGGGVGYAFRCGQHLRAKFLWQR
ncbi:hypothetical protein [Actinoplanes sp. NBRC 103695]|uniref:hypothetical protein n=1 Tax=Actinoplanes sp. NBRC 103695 TaxID=3032202 RepID=UPI0024A3B235|nr:hypothetical protein [Actinoplanes sp. NBRC 103695]GLY95128.1 hypothetical protein Acsp02_23830 [Actinoplanes sp. NBRC 103695]